MTVDLSQPIGSRMDALREYVRQLPRGCQVLETGTLRGCTPEHITGDGWSTAILAYEVAQLDGTLVTIDLRDRLEQLEEAIPHEYRKHVIHHVLDSATAIQTVISGDVHMALLDSHRDPAVMLAEFKALEPKLAPGALVCVDDAEVKGLTTVPLLEERGYERLRGENPQVWRKPA